ncbi:unnamed protein product [Onchocerca ochengi]|uniref:Uncharacterized protein n=1 Tax=Onchocerca ochengi TaxID=42157 RepID=A0A182E7S4_ONCOC|nr:unnamed protein product [Onchocerca ochengi]
MHDMLPPFEETAIIRAQRKTKRIFDTSSTTQLPPPKGQTSSNLKCFNRNKVTLLRKEKEPQEDLKGPDFGAEVVRNRIRAQVRSFYNDAAIATSNNSNGAEPKATQQFDNSIEEQSSLRATKIRITQ